MGLGVGSRKNKIQGVTSDGNSMKATPATDFFYQLLAAPSAASERQTWQTTLHRGEKKTEERNKPNYSNRVHNGCILCQHCLEMEEVESWERETGSPPSLVVRNYARQNSAVKHDDDYLYITNNLTVYIRSYVIIPDVQKLRQRCHVTTWSRDRVCI